jgi:hypothetical protein
MVAHACDSSIWRQRSEELQFEASLGKKLARFHLNQKAGCGRTPVIPAVQEA